MSFPSPAEVFSTRPRLLKPPAGLYRSVKSPDDQHRVLRQLKTFTAIDYAKAANVCERHARNRIADYLSKGILEAVGFELRQGVGISSRAMQVFRLKRGSDARV